MIDDISIPVLTPFKFYPSDRPTGDGINFQNIDNTELNSQDWEGVYPREWAQPVARYWNDFTPGIDFQIIINGVQAYGDTSVTFEDLSGNQLFTLKQQNFFTLGTDVIARFYADSFDGIDDGCYRMTIRVQSHAVYTSEIFRLADTHEDCYPLEFSNFENDFGLIFLNASAATWAGKILIPLRMFKPTTQEEKEVYDNDVGSLTTLRTIPKRVYEIESYPVSTWFAEKIKMMFGCSDLILNRVAVNTEAGVAIEVVSETDRMEITGNFQLNDFTDDYVQDDATNVVTELLTAWTDDGATVGDWAQFDAAAKDIELGLYEFAGIASANSNSFSVVLDQTYLFQIEVTGVLVTSEMEFDGQTYGLSVGKNTYLWTSTATGSESLILTVGEDSNFAAVCSFKKIT